MRRLVKRRGSIPFVAHSGTTAKALKTHRHSHTVMGTPLSLCQVTSKLRAGFARTVYIYSVIRQLAGESPYIRSYTVHICGSGQPYLSAEYDLFKCRVWHFVQLVWLHLQMCAGQLYLDQGCFNIALAILFCAIGVATSSNVRRETVRRETVLKYSTTGPLNLLRPICTSQVRTGDKMKAA